MNNMAPMNNNRMPVNNIMRRLVWPPALAAAAAVGLAACATGPRTSDKDLRIINQHKLAELRHASDSQAMLIDVRPHPRYVRGHIPGALNIPMPRLHRDDSRLAEATSLIVYSEGADDPLAPAAAKKMIMLGYSNVYDFRAGLTGWTQRGGPVAGAQNAP